MDKKIIMHISEVDIKLSSGMGRVEFYWKQAFEKMGFTFMHIGPAEVGPMKHQSLFPGMAWRYYKKLGVRPAAFIVHEPAAAYFVNQGIPCFLESHGIERRNWENQLNGLIPIGVHISLRTRLLFPLWRLRGCDKGLKCAKKLLLINSDDSEYARKKYGRSKDDIFVFRNGVSAFDFNIPNAEKQPFTVLFNGTWIERKGTHLLVKAAEILANRGLEVQYMLIGAGKEKETVMSDWPEHLKPFVTVHSSFKPEEEASFLAKASVFVLPSYFEGQPLSLLQAMSSGKCCITTNCCGQKDIIDNGRTGLLFEPGDVNGFASLLQTCYNDHGLVESIGSAARAELAGRTWQAVSDELAAYVSAHI